FPRIAARADGACMTAAARKPAARPSVLEAFTLRCWARAQRYAVGEIGLHDAIDELQRAAEASGLIAELGQDEVQRLMVEAFAPLRDDLPAENVVVGNIFSDDDTFADLCRLADEKQRREAADPHLERLRELMDDDVALERAWRELNKRPPGDVPIATLNAAEFLVKQGDHERFKRWLDTHSAEQRDAIRKHLRAKRERRS